MNIRLSFLLVAILLIFGGTFLVFQLTGSSGSNTPDRPWLYKVDDGSLVNIQIIHAGQTVEYQKKPGSNTWYIQDEDRETQVFQEKWSGTTLLLSGPKVNRVLAASFDNLTSTAPTT